MSDKKKIPNMNERLERIDVVDAAEKALGKPWEEWTDDDQLCALTMIMGFNSMRQSVEKNSGDTYMGITVSETEGILKDLGFEIGWRKYRISPKYNYNECETIWYSPDGLVVYCETYNSTSPNVITLFGELKLSEDNWEEEYQDIFRIYSGGGFCDTYKGGRRWGDEKEPEGPKQVSFSADVRNGLRWRTELARSTGTLLKKWEHKKYTWMVNYDEKEEFKDTIATDEALRDILKEKLKSATPELREIMEIYT